MNKFSIKALFCAVVTVGAIPVGANARGIDIQCDQNYSVVSGDTLSRISMRAYGSLLYQPIYTANVKTIGTNPDLILIGQSLIIPCLAASGTTEAAKTDTAPQTDKMEVKPSNDDEAVVEQLVFTFNKASAPPFIINSGIINEYLTEITEVTEGRVTFIDPEVMNRDHAEQYELVTSGQVDGAYVLNSTLESSHPLLQLSMMPMFGGSAEQTAVSLWRLHEKYLAETDYLSEVELLGIVAAPAAHIWRDNSMPVSADEDIADKNIYHIPYFHGLDTRGPAAMRAEVAELKSNFSATSNEPPTYFMAHGAAVALGVWSEGSNVSVLEVDNGLYTPSFSVVLSDEAWAQISLDDQEAIRKISGEVLSHRSEAWDGFDNAFRAEMLKSGLEVEKADRALLETLFLSSLDDLNLWKKNAEDLGVPSIEAINFYLENLRSLENRLIYRGEETYVGESPFVAGEN